jgi:estrogen-related receptor beta like 1
LAQITAALNTTKKTIKEKGKSMTDMSPLVEIKTTLQSVRAEIKDLDIRIGVMVSRVSPVL